MPKTLHILTRPDDAVADEVISRQEAMKNKPEICRFDLTAEKPDYERLLNEIFEANSVQMW